MGLHVLAKLETLKQTQSPVREKSKTPQGRRGGGYTIESLQSRDQKAQVIEQERSIVERNVANQVAQSQLALQDEPAQREPTPPLPPKNIYL